MSRATAQLMCSLLALSALSSPARALDGQPPRRAETAELSVAPQTGTPLGAAGVALESDEVRVETSAQGAAIRHVVMKEPRYQRGGKPIDIATTDKPAFLPLGLSIAGAKLAPDAFWKAERLSGRAVRFSTQAGPIQLVRKLELGTGPYQLWSTLRLRNTGTSQVTLKVAIEGHHYVERASEKGSMFAARSPLMSGVICMGEDGPKRFDSSDALEDKPTMTGPVLFGSVDNVYFTQAIAAHGKPFKSCRVTGSPRGGSLENPIGTLLTVSLDHDAVTLAPGKEATLRALAYLGPKSPRILEKAGHSLSRASFGGGIWGIDRIALGLVGMLAAIHNVVPNWGVAIILLTLMVKLVLYPLTAKSFESMAAMRKLKPEIDALNEKYADDREKKGAAMMELYKKHKINPFGGCLPQLFQLPIWWALYSSLSTNVELLQRPFILQWQDLTAPDPYYVLPLALGLLMWVQQKITPSTMDPQQAKMMLYMMPTMITAFMLFLPAGLCLYMFTNSLLSIAQQRFIEHRLGHKGGSGSPPRPAGSPSGTKVV